MGWTSPSRAKASVPPPVVASSSLQSFPPLPDKEAMVALVTPPSKPPLVPNKKTSSDAAAALPTSSPGHHDKEERDDDDEEEADDDAALSASPSHHQDKEEHASSHEVEEQEDHTVRRSGRARTSTVLHINGHAVLKQNNYVVKGMSYHYDTNIHDDSSKNMLPTKRKQPSPTKKKPDEARKIPRVVPPEEVARQEQSATVRARVQAKASMRGSFLAKHVSVLEPFLETSVRTKVLQQYDPSAAAKKTYPNPHLVPQQPQSILAEMRDYQMEGLRWMVHMHQQNLGMILYVFEIVNLFVAPSGLFLLCICCPFFLQTSYHFYASFQSSGDEMGLGKTLQTISLLCYLKEHENFNGPSLVICPLSVLYSWCNELAKWAPSLKVLRFHSSSMEERMAQRLAFQKDAMSYDVVVTTYEMAKQPQLKNLWSRQYFNYLVLDEGHKIKDATNQISQAVRHIHCENALILTGTPLQNNLVELWSLLNFLYPDVFLSNKPFAEAFDIVHNVVNKETLHAAQKLLSIFMLRRLKDQVEKLMPKKIETKVLCPLSSTQVFWYKALLMKDIGALARTEDGNVNGSSAKVLNNLIMQLRKCCLHPFLFPDAEGDVDETSVEDLIAASGKLAVLDKLLRSLYQKGHRTVLFSQFTSVLDILEDYCVLRGWPYCRFDGATARAKRNYIVNSFNAPNSSKFIFLMSTRSGGMGLNLQTAGE